MGGGFLVDTAVLLGVLCERDRFHDYARCIAERALQAHIRLYVLPHVAGELLLKLESLGGRWERCSLDLGVLSRRFGFLLRGYSRDGFARLFYVLSSNAAASTRVRDQLYVIGESVETHGVNDFLLLFALYADSELTGLITTERRLLNSPLIAVLEELAGEPGKLLGPAPHRVFSDCEKMLPM